MNTGELILPIGLLMYGHNCHSKVSVLYDKELLYYPGFSGLMKQFEKVYKLEFLNITRIDISLDTNRNLIRRIKTLYSCRENFLMSCRSEINNLNTRGKFSKDKKCFKTQTISFERKDKISSLVIYDKKSQLLETREWDNVSFIREYFTDKFSDSEPIYRMELRLHSRLFKKYGNRTFDSTTVTIDEIDISQLEEHEYLVSVFADYYPNLMEFRKKTHPVNKSKCQKIKFIDLNDNGVGNARKCTRIQERRKIDEFKIEQLKELEIYFKVTDNIDFYVNQTGKRSDKRSLFFHSRLLRQQKKELHRAENEVLKKFETYWKN